MLFKSPSKGLNAATGCINGLIISISLIIIVLAGGIAWIYISEALK